MNKFALMVLALAFGGLMLAGCPQKDEPQPQPEAPAAPEAPENGETTPTEGEEPAAQPADETNEG